MKYFSSPANEMHFSDQQLHLTNCQEKFTNSTNRAIHKIPFPDGIYSRVLDNPRLKVILLHWEIRKTRLASSWRVVVSWVYAKQKVVSTSTWFQAQFSQAKYPAMLGVVGQQCSVCLHLGIIQFWELYFIVWFSDTQVLLPHNPKTQSSSL